MSGVCARPRALRRRGLSPLLLLFRSTGEPRYLERALQLFDWSATCASWPDDSWPNEVSASGAQHWKGISCFSVIALGEALRHHGDAQTVGEREKRRRRLQTGTDFLMGFADVLMAQPQVDINYPISVAVASMNRYWMFKVAHMQPPQSAGQDYPLTPRLEVCEDGAQFSNVFDALAKVSALSNAGAVDVRVMGHLVDHKGAARKADRCVLASCKGDCGCGCPLAHLRPCHLSGLDAASDDGGGAKGTPVFLTLSALPSGF